MENRGALDGEEVLESIGPSSTTPASGSVFSTAMQHYIYLKVLLKKQKITTGETVDQSKKKNIFNSIAVTCISSTPHKNPQKESIYSGLLPCEFR
jgi:hypothetical protein